MKYHFYIKYVLGFGSFLALLSACSVGRNYQRPESISQNYLREQQAEEIDSTFEVTSWETYFQDQTLKAHIETALTNNLNLNIATQQLLQAEALLKQAKLGQLPSVNISADGRQTFGGSGFNAFNSYALNAGISWEADLWGKIRAQKKAAEFGYASAQEGKKAIQALVINNVAALYLNLMSLDQQLEITTETQKLRQKTLETLQALKEVGMVNEVNLQQASAQIYVVETQQEVLKNAIYAQENALAVLMGLPAQHITRGKLVDFHIEGLQSTQFHSSILENRPDVKTAELQLMQSLQLANVAKSQFYPSLTLSASGGFNAMELKDWFSPESALFALAGSITQPIFNKRAIKTQYEIALSNEQIALLNFEQSMRVAGQELTDALKAIELNETQISLVAKTVEANTKAVEASELLLQQGMINYLDLLVAQENELNAQLQLVNLERQKFVNYLQLYRAIGGGI